MNDDDGDDDEHEYIIFDSLFALLVKIFLQLMALNVVLMGGGAGTAGEPLQLTWQKFNSSTDQSTTTTTSHYWFSFDGWLMFRRATVVFDVTWLFGDEFLNGGGG
jgi:hypothetical protein